MKIIGLTGGIASGKSTVSAYLHSKEIPVFDADAVSHEAEAKGSVCLPKIVEIFGPQSLTPSGELDRKWVGQEAFTNPAKLAALNNIVHSYCDQARKVFISQNNQEKIVVLDVPLLIECNWYKKVDEVWLVAVDKETQIKRAMVRSGLSRAEVVSRINNQMSLEEKKKYAEVIIDNSGGLNELYAQVDAALYRFEIES